MSLSKKRSVSLTTAVLLFLLPLASTQATYHIVPTSDSPCPHEDCLTLSEYASQNRSYSNSVNLTLVFLPGEHVLNTSIVFQLLGSVTLLGNNYSLPNLTSKIVCRESSAFVLKGIYSVEIEALAFISCGRSGNSTVSITMPKSSNTSDTLEAKSILPAVSVLLIMNFHLVGCQFQGNSLPLLLDKTEAIISDSQFIHNTGGLGGAVAAYSSTVSFLGRNRFVNNLAKVGGGIFANNSKLVITGSTVFHANSATYGGGIGAAYSTLTFGVPKASQNETDFQGRSGVLLNDSTSQRLGGNSTNRINSSSEPGFLSDVLFEKNRGYGGGVFTLYSTSNSMNANITFVDNWGLEGAAINSRDSQLRFGAVSCIEFRQQSIPCSSVLSSHVLVTFTNNFSGNGGAIFVYNSTVAFNGNSTFEQNQAMFDGGGICGQSNAQVFFAGQTTFVSNSVGPFKSARGGGGVYSHASKFYFSGQTAFIGNVAGNGAGISATGSSYIRISGESVFSRNKASKSGGGVRLDVKSDLVLSGAGMYIGNEAAMGGAFSASDRSGLHIYDASITMAMNSASINGGAISLMSAKSFVYTYGAINLQVVGNWAKHNGGAVYAEECTLNMNGVFKFEGNAARKDGYGGAIHAVKTWIRLSGFYNFTNNSAKYGGGMAITSYSNYFFSLLEPYTSVSFYDNHAQYGGAMFVEDDHDHYCNPDLPVIGRNCFINFENSYGILEEHIHLNYSQLPECMGHFVFEGNYAEEGGTAIYGGALHNCRVNVNSRTSCSNKFKCHWYQTCYISGLEAIATLTRTSVEQLTLDPLNFMSDTYIVCICDLQRPNCKARDVNYTAFPGEMTSLPLTAIENDRIQLSVVIHAEANSETGEVRLGPLQNTQAVTTPCSHLGYSLFSRGTRSARLLLSAEGQCRRPGIPLVVHMDFLPCPFGFSLSQSGSCICEERLQKYTNSCDINGRTFTRHGDFWLGFSSHGLILHQHCPFDYCKLETVTFTHNSTDLQCAGGRSGTLCGACKSGFSLNLGSSRCSPCSNVYLLLLLPFTIAGLLLVTFLFICKVTVAAGTTSGLIFYANVLAVNKSVFFPSSETNILTVFIAWLNLDLGIEACFISEMDVYTRTWMQFVFPFYILMLVGLLTLVSRYSMRFARIIGPTNPISVLATLFLLSYTKLLRTIIATFSFTTLDYPNDRRVTVWVYDGNIGYFEGKHIPLFLAGQLAFLFLFLPYTLLLLFGQCIEAGSNHRLLSWANNPKVRSFLDAYHAPYKNRHRYWTGLLLLFRFVLFITSAVVDINSPKDPNVNLLVLGITCIVLTIWIWNTGSMYQKWYNNVLESSFFLNLTILTLASYQVKVERGNQAAVVYTSVSIAFVTFLGIITYHVLQRVVDSRIWRHSAIRSKLNRLKDKRRQHQAPTEMTVPPTAPRPHPVTTTFVDLRESLLESQH